MAELPPLSPPKMAMSVLLLLSAVAGLPGQSPTAPSCMNDKMSACWIEAANQPECRLWHEDRAPSLEADWSGLHRTTPRG